VGEAVFTRPRQHWRGQGEAAENQAEARQLENHVSSRRRSISWSTVSRQQIHRVEPGRTCRRSLSSRMSDNTFNTAVSVEWLARYADWRLGRRPAELRWDTSCRATIFSNSFDRPTVRFEMGRYDRTSDGSRSIFSNVEWYRPLWRLQERTQVRVSGWPVQ